MKKIFLFLSIIVPFMAVCQTTITGKIFDASNNHPLAHASIMFKKGNAGITAGNDGKFALIIPENIKAITVSYVGYEMLR